MKLGQDMKRLLVAVTLAAVGMLLVFSPGLRLGAVAQATRTSPIDAIPASTESQREQQLALRRLLFLVHSLELESRLSNPADDRSGDCEAHGLATLTASATPSEYRPIPWIPVPATKSLRAPFAIPCFIFAFDSWLSAAFSVPATLVCNHAAALPAIERCMAAPSLLPRGGIH